MSLVVLRGGGLASGAEAPHPRRSPRPAPEQPAPETGVVLRSRSPTRHSSAEAPGPGGSPQDSSESSATPEVVLEGQDVTHRRPLPFPVGLTGVHAGAEPPGNVVARKASDDPGSGHPAANGTSGPQASKSRQVASCV